MPLLVPKSHSKYEQHIISKRTREEYERDTRNSVIDIERNPNSLSYNTGTRRPDQQDFSIKKNYLNALTSSALQIDTLCGMIKESQPLEYLVNAAIECTKLPEFNGTIENQDCHHNEITKSSNSSSIPASVTSNCDMEINKPTIFVAPNSLDVSDQTSTSENQNECYVVTSDSLSIAMESRGYKRLRVRYCDNLSDLLDNGNSSSTVVRNPINTLHDPEQIRLPQNGRVPRLCKRKETVARKIVTAFEEKVIDDDEGMIYSPLRLWRSIERQKVKLKDSNFTVRCNCYYAVRKLLKGKDPDTIDYTASKLKRMAVDATKAERLKLSTEGKQFHWFDACVQIYKELKQDM